MAWTTPRTWVSGELVTASMMNTHVRDNLLYLYGLSGAAKYTSYTPTLLPVSNNTETAALAFSLPADSMADGDVIDIFLAALYKNNKGSGGNITFKLNVGAGAQVTINSGATTASDVATEYKSTVFARFMRVGSSVWVPNRGGGYPFSGNPFGTNNEIIGVSTPADFTNANTVSLKVTLDATHANFYYTPQSAHVGHRKAA